MTRALIDILERAACFYRDQLVASPRSIAYLKARGLRGDTAARYRIGFASAEFQGLRSAFPNYDDPALEKSGLVVANDAGQRFDRFRDRIMFPILDAAGEVVGFGGRVLEGDGPKYLNSPETAVFKKGDVLFGLHQASEAIAATSEVCVVEGYVDVLSLAQHGVQNAVATLGTATTGSHVERLLSLAGRVVFCFDGDAAGRRAAAHALSVCLPYITDLTDIAFLFLPCEHDPDSFVRLNGGDAFIELAVSAPSLEGFFLANAIQGCSLEFAEGRAALVARAAPSLKKIVAPAVLRRLVDAISLYTRFTVNELLDLCEINIPPHTIDGQ